MEIKRWVYGTKTLQWYLVGSGDRDYIYGFTQEEIDAIGWEAAKELYLSPSRI